MHLRAPCREIIVVAQTKQVINDNYFCRSTTTRAAGFA